MYGAGDMEEDKANAKKNGCTACKNGDVEAHVKANFVGKGDKTSEIGLCSSQEYLSLDTVLNEEGDTWADKFRSSERSLTNPETMPLLVMNACPRFNLSQPDEALLLQNDQDHTSSEQLSEAARNSTVSRHPPCDILPDEKVGLPKSFDSAGKESSISEDLENNNDLRSNILKQHSTSIKRRDNLPGFCENDLERNVGGEPSSTDVSGYHPDRTIGAAVTDVPCDIFSMKNIKNSGKDLCLTEGTSIQSNGAEKDIVGITLNYSSCSSEVKQHMVDSMPLLTECCNDKNFETTFQKLIQTTSSEKVNRPLLEENISTCTNCLPISIEINQKVFYGNFKGEPSLPPSPITGVIDAFVGKPNRQNNHLNSLNVEEISFSFQLPSKNISNNEIGFGMQGGRVADSHDCCQTLREHPLNVLSVGIHGDRVTKEKESISSFVGSSTSEDDLPSKRRKKVNDLCPVPREISLTCLSRKKLLVLDLNGLLCDIVNNYTAHRGERRVGGKPIFKRPFCEDFLKFCFDRFVIGIWSSRRKYNVDSALDYLMGELKHKLLFCWDQSKCTHTGVKTLENHYKPLVLKELRKLWDKEESDLPWEKGEFSPTNTLLLDDSPYKALCNPPHTAIFPYPYQYTDEGDKALGPGGDIRVYLEHILSTDNVQRFVEEHPFGQPAITTSDQHWNFYCDIINSQAALSS